jgi:DNA helicase-2/ATP-dependent DNA helicase PcrA
MDFTKRYGSLNKAQKKAVDTIEGPVMVIAGPGTGKTELLSVRAANILRSTDTLPENILCLTFTESGASAMRERLRTIIGKDAYKVAIHTFHSFGTEIMNQFSEFFYEGAHFRPADDLSRYEIIHSIFETLGHANVLNKKMNGDYTYLSESLTVISELK